ncbi:unnamed protein product [Fraxinus pennsylvanica]|uniref:Uncharacterized protein n=1 Tax=Fraxinus pennsylvanica TaxID=56036 RepID=A0AAD2AIT3_9LAMI|nr:unnamed protein product [Fraxinus pennsylvanica]
MQDNASLLPIGWVICMLYNNLKMCLRSTDTSVDTSEVAKGSCDGAAKLSLSYESKVTNSVSVSVDAKDKVDLKVEVEAPEKKRDEPKTEVEVEVEAVKIQSTALFLNLFFLKRVESAFSLDLSKYRAQKQISHHPTHINYGVDDFLRCVPQCQLYGNFGSPQVDMGGLSDSLGVFKLHLSWLYLLSVLIG